MEAEVNLEMAIYRNKISEFVILRNITEYLHVYQLCDLALLI